VPVADGGHRLLLDKPGAAADTGPKRSAPLKAAAKAHRIVETGHSGSKVILIS
jgi:hypothetical protein